MLGRFGNFAVMTTTPKKPNSPTILAGNLKRLMSISEKLSTQKELAKASGVSQTAISLMRRPDERKPTNSGKLPSPKLAEVELVAHAFGIEVWQLLIDPATFGEAIATALTTAAIPDATLHKHGIAKPRQTVKS